MVRRVRYTIRQRIAGIVRTFERALHDEQRLRMTIVRLRESGEIAAERAARLDAVLDGMTSTTTYILRHLAIHLGIGASKTVLLPGVPIVGSMLRAAWVVLARLQETLRRRPERARVHSLPVFFVACLPLVGYSAYIVALRHHDPEAAFLYANHLSYMRFDRSLEAVLENKPRILRAAIRRAVGGVPTPDR